MRAARTFVERVEEYRFYSGSIDDVRGLSTRQIGVRLHAFYKVVKKANKTKATSGKTRKRLRR